MGLFDCVPPGRGGETSPKDVGGDVEQQNFIRTAAQGTAVRILYDPLTLDSRVAWSPN